MMGVRLMAISGIWMSCNKNRYILIIRVSFIQLAQVDKVLTEFSW